MTDKRCPKCWAILPRHYPPCRATRQRPRDLALDREYKARERARKALAGECLRCRLPALPDRSFCGVHLLEQRTQKGEAYRRKRAPYRQGVVGQELHAYHCSRCGGPRHNRIACEAPKRAGEGRR